MQTDGLICVWKAPSRRIAGGSAEKKRKWPHAGRSVWGHAVCPCLPCPQRGPRRTFWSAWPPRRQPQNLPPLNFYAIGWKLFNIYPPIDVYFLREGLQETFLCLTQLLREGSQTVLGLSTFLLLWCFNLTLLTSWRARSSSKGWWVNLESSVCVCVIIFHHIDRPDWFVNPLRKVST